MEVFILIGVTALISLLVVSVTVVRKWGDREWHEPTVDCMGSEE